MSRSHRLRPLSPPRHPMEGGFFVLQRARAACHCEGLPLVRGSCALVSHPHSSACLYPPAGSRSTREGHPVLPRYLGIRRTSRPRVDLALLIADDRPGGGDPAGGDVDEAGAGGRRPVRHSQGVSAAASAQRPRWAARASASSWASFGILGHRRGVVPRIARLHQRLTEVPPVRQLHHGQSPGRHASGVSATTATGCWKATCRKNASASL